jgi:chromosome segregation ATPase
MTAAHKRETEEMRHKISIHQVEVTRLENLNQAQASSIEELEESLAQLKMELRAEEKAHTITQHDLEAAKRDMAEAEHSLAQKQVECDELRSEFEQKCTLILQLEADKKMLELSNAELENELEKTKQQMKQQMDRLNGMLDDANERCETLEKRKELVDKQLAEKMAEVDRLAMEVEDLEETVATLKDANEEMYRESQKALQESQKEIFKISNEMEEMRMQLTAKMRQLEDTLERVQRDRDELESAYQFAKDELGVIRTTLAAMEEGKQRVQYITEQPGNPTLVNRMNSEWGRVAGIPHIHLADSASPRMAPGSGAFARDFRMSHSIQQRDDDLSDAPRQGDFARDHWRP